MSDTITIGRGTNGPLSVDPLKLVDSRVLIQANSGGGKSYLLRGIVEQVAGKLQTIILDPEGEFATLRERVDVLLVGREGEVKTSVRGAALLARRLAELNVSAVIDLYDLKLHERREFVRDFTGALLNLPRDLWHPMLVAIDEAHVFAPERSAGESVATENIIGLASQGRKRGIGLVALTQRLSKLHKDAAAELNNVFIGRTWLPNDQERCGDLLGMNKPERTTLRDLDAGEFYAFGPAIESAGVTRFKAAAVKTTHPKAGERHTIAPPAPSKAMRSVAAELANLPAQAEAEIKDLASAKAEVAKLRRLIGEKPAAEVRTIEKPVVTDAHVKRVETIVDRLEREGERRIKAGQELTASGQELKTTAADFAAALRRAKEPMPRIVAPVARITPTAVRRESSSSASADASMPKGERSMVIACAQYPAGCNREQLSILTGYKRSTRDAYVQRACERGYLEVRGDVVLVTQAGIDAIGSDYEPLPTGDALLAWWLPRLPEGERKILAMLAEHPGQYVDRDAIGEATDFKRSTRDAYLQRLGTRKLVAATREGVKASDELFDASAV